LWPQAPLNGELVRIGEATGELEEYKCLIGAQLKVNGLLRLMTHTRGSPPETSRSRPAGSGRVLPESGQVDRNAADPKQSSETSGSVFERGHRAEFFK
jgi:hypothetical protein